MAALIGGGVWYFTNSHKTDENLVMAEKYMDRGDFDKALEYYQKAQAEAKDPAALDATIQLIKDYQICRGLRQITASTPRPLRRSSSCRTVSRPGFRDVQGHRGFAR